MPRLPMIARAVLGAGFIITVHVARTLGACTADDLAAVDPVNCPNIPVPCTITTLVTIDDGCEIDLGSRDLVIATGGQFSIGSGSVTIDAQNVSISGGSIDGRTAASNGVGGSITINTAAAFAVRKSGSSTGRIDVSASTYAGAITINAGGTATIAGMLSAQATSTDGNGGQISITTGLDIVGASGGLISARGDQAEVDLVANGAINIPILVDVSGANSSLSDGGTLNVTANGDVSFGGDLQASAASQDGGNGGTVTIEGGGKVQLSGRTYANGANGGDGGTVSVTADTGSLTIVGDVQATGAIDGGNGGTISLAASSDSVVAQATAAITAVTNDTDGTGGMITVTAGLDITVAGTVDVSGGDAGSMEICADRAIIVQGALNANGLRTDDSGAGGSISVDAGTQAQLLSAISANGSVGGNGGSIEATALFGDVTVAKSIQAKGVSPGGVGGSIALTAEGSVTMQPTATLSARSDAADGDGGSIDLEAGIDITVNNQIDASGGTSGGTVTANAGGNLAAAANLLANGRSAASPGGTISLHAGQNQTGNRGTVSISKTVDVSSGGCGADGFCGDGGSIDIEACTVVINSTAVVRARGTDIGGTNSLVAHERLTVLGRVDATASAAGGSDGSNALRYPSRNSQIITASLITPTATVSALATCTATGQAGCLLPCPTCGNGIVEFPEACDNNNGTPAGCDGCSAFCQIETCTDGDPCTADTCDPLLGCHFVPAPELCVTPALTPTITTTPGPGTPSATPTPTRTPTPKTPQIPPGDANCDGQVTAADLPSLLILLSDGAAPVCGADANGDGVIDDEDVGALISLINAQ